MMIKNRTRYQPETEQTESSSNLLPPQHLERVWSWGGASSSVSHVFRPNTVDGLRELFALARRTGRTVGLRGGGNSYGDAAMNAENMVLDLRRMNRILDWDPRTGRVRAEPGVTLQQLWEYTLEDGWWPPVVTGTMKTTLGGCAAMNVHGKNAWQVGPIGDHIYEFDLMLPSGEIITCHREQHSDIFHAAIGGFGMFGCFTAITLDLKRVYSGYVQVEELASSNLEEMMNQFDRLLPVSDYLVGWVDATARGRSLGRGQIHKANYLPPGADPYPGQSLRLDRQHLPDLLLGFVPRSVMWLFMRPFLNNRGVPLINWAKYLASQRNHGHVYLQPHASFHFLLDYVPNWKKAYGPGGLIQYQSFIPAENALNAFTEMFTLCQERGLPNYLSVLKRHRPDPFLMTHGLDGYSMAMDFRITARNRGRIAALARELDEIVLGANGRFYFAKDSTLRPEVAHAYLGAETIARFETIRAKCDPQGVMQTNLWRRVFAS